MREITALRVGRGRSKRIKIYLDGKPALNLEPETVTKEGLRLNQDLSDDQIEALAKSDSSQRCFNTALRFLRYRPRSEAELRDRLRQRGFDSDTREAAITRLKNQGLVDDNAFAQFWKDNRDSFSPRSQRLTGLELRRKGLSKDIIAQTLNGLDDSDSAYRAALSKANRLTESDYQVFQRRLGDYLRRRGFSYEVINHTLQQIWKEKGGK